MLKTPLHLLPCQMMETLNMVLSCVDLVRMGKILDTWNVMHRMKKETIYKINATSQVSGSLDNAIEEFQWLRNHSTWVL